MDSDPKLGSNYDGDHISDGWYSSTGSRADVPGAMCPTLNGSSPSMNFFLEEDTMNMDLNGSSASMDLNGVEEDIWDIFFDSSYFTLDGTKEVGDASEKSLDVIGDASEKPLDVVGHEAVRPCNINDEKKQEVDEIPRDGMKFSSLLEAEEFYNLYAKKVGFKVRKGKVGWQRNGTPKWKRFLCSCEGLRAKNQFNLVTKYQRTETRTGCNAQMQVTCENEEWVITNFHRHHNHDLKNQSQCSDRGVKDGPAGDNVFPRAELEVMKSHETLRDTCTAPLFQEHQPQLPMTKSCPVTTSNQNRRSRPQQKLGDEDSVSSKCMVRSTDEVESDFGNAKQNPPSVAEKSVRLSLSTISQAQLPANIDSTLAVPKMASWPSVISGDQRSQSASSGSLGGQTQGSGLSAASESIWQQIYTKYGDITAKCLFKSPQFVTTIRDSIVKTVKLLLKKTARGLSASEISKIGKILLDLERAHVNVDWLKSRFVAVKPLIQYAQAEGRRDMILTCLNAGKAEVAKLEKELSQTEARLKELECQLPEGLTIQDALGKGLL